MQIFGIAGRDFSPSVGIVQLPCPFTLPIAVASHSAHPLSQLAVHRSSLSTTAKLVLQIYELPHPRSRSRRAYRSSSTGKRQPDCGSTSFSAPFRHIKPGPDDIAKVDIDTSTKELAELSFQLEDKLLQETHVNNIWEFGPCRQSASCSGNSDITNNIPPPSVIDSSFLPAARTTINICALSEHFNGLDSPAQGHLHEQHLPEDLAGRLFGLPNTVDVFNAGDEPPLRLSHPSPFALEAPQSRNSLRQPFPSNSQDEQFHDETFTPAVDDTALSLSRRHAYISNWVQSTSPSTPGYALDPDSRFSMVMEVLSSEPLYIRHRSFDEDLWSFSSAGAVLHDQTTVAEIYQQASSSGEPRRAWLFRSLHDRVFHTSSRQRQRPRRNTPPLARNELGTETTSSSITNEDNDTERDTEEEAAKAIDRAEEAAMELAEEAAAEEMEHVSFPSGDDEGSSASVDQSTSISFVPGHSHRPSVSDATLRPPSRSSESSGSDPPVYTPDWMSIGRDRLGYEWWFLVDEDCDLHWQFSYVNNEGRRVFLPHHDYERVQAMHRRTRALAIGRLNVLTDETYGADT
ncbi:hypothetical protein DACRYDRAFT_102754 [Dacryopinax primogenitus]|uniref:Uncharacterized protein n=1 Tax=Dacryopinax primogenitus (strain DJM 731) TaxID=1858805 RepID=M5FN16_DACPD|nr:uncharacterized protein DACRYDRAFT_102754 [Dacryopinax primogenitus]EJT96660.1 hypothetical protein DACRYDRAFT_102754 [Dacryopinax primogenitus]